VNSAYLQQLNSRLADGIGRWPEDFRRRHADYLARHQNADGGFSGREGDSDLYYTGFALRGLAILDALTPQISARAGDYLRSRMAGQAAVVDFYSFLYACMLVQAGGGPDVLANSPADWPERVAATLETFRTSDGGYGKTSGAVSGSTYHTFLVGLCYQLLGRSYPSPEDTVRFIRSRQREDSGFVELAAMRRSGTNPTAAAIGVLQMIAGPTGVPNPDSVVAFLSQMRSTEGGFRANARAPLADLLSTFTGAWSLDQLGAPSCIHTDEVRRYVQALELPGGGFRGGLWDETTDVEYTFYGLGVAALTAGP
jgi:geranylgeranyl transferase type-2 subunit beta